MRMVCLGLHRTSNAAAYMDNIRRAGRLAPLLIFLFILAGCVVQESFTVRGTQESFTVSGTPRPLSCEIFTEFPWHEFNFGVDSPADVASKAIELWKVEQDQFRFTNLYGDDLELAWSGSHGRREINYSALFSVERQLERIDVTWTPPATAAQVIDCLGAPGLYSAYYGPSYHEAIFYLDLWYPDKGFSVHQDFYTRVTPLHPVEAALRIDGFRVTASTLPEQAAPRLHTVGYDLLSTAYDLCRLRSWPGSLEAIEAHDEDPRCK